MDAAQLIAEPMRTQGASRARSPAGSPGSGLRVLIIDDDDYMRMVIARLLRRLGTADVAEAANGIEAIAELRPERPRYDLLVCDIDMPGSDGMEFMRLAAESGITVPLLVLSGKAPALLRGVRIIGAEYGLKILRIAPKPPTVAILGQALADCRDAAQPEPAILSRAFSGKAIAEGLEQRQFEPFFQPKVRVETREVCGCEALARWRHPMHGLLPPAAFIADLEAAGLMEQLTGSIIEQSAVRCTNWRVAGFDVPVSVNLSMSSLSNTALADCLVDLVRAAGSAPSDFTLEVTETIGMTDVARCMETLVRLRLRGFGLSIDDFGTGFSSLQQLERVPYTELKIDRSFVDGVARQDRLRTVLESSVGIARRLGLASVAEGVEAAEDWECLRATGCDIAQGYLIAAPMSGNDIQAWTSAWRRSQAHRGLRGIQSASTPAAPKR